jgi:flagellar hook-basal body complex protein FliE
MDAVNGKGKLGKLFNRADYPTVDELRALYSRRIHTYPMPKTDYVAQAQSEVGQIIAQTMATEMAERFKEAMQFAWTKLHDSLTWALDTCENIEAGKAGAKVHDVSCKRLLSLADDLKYLNIADDPKLETARQQLEVLLNGKSAASLKESLKNDPDARTTIVTKVREMKSLLDF